MLEDEYYRRVKTAILYSKEYGNLMGKSEVGEEISQYATVDLAGSLSEYMAEELGYNGSKASVLAMCKGIIFPPYGQAGMEYIKQLAKNENIDIREEQICKVVINKILKENNFKMSEDLEEGIENLFVEGSTNDESEIVNNIYNTLDDMDNLKENSNSMEGKLRRKTFDIVNSIIKESENKGKISRSPQLEELKNLVGFRSKKRKLDETQKNTLDQLWEEYKNNTKEIPKLITGQEK